MSKKYFRVKIDDLVYDYEPNKVRNLLSIMRDDWGLGKVSNPQEYEYLHKMDKEMKHIKPVVVSKRCNNKYSLANGHHRVAIALYRGRKTIEARNLQTGDSTEFGVVSCTVNDKKKAKK